jgi:hypothetical protein
VRIGGSGLEFTFRARLGTWPSPGEHKVREDFIGDVAAALVKVCKIFVSFFEATKKRL